MYTILNNQFAGEPQQIMYYVDQINTNTNIRSETIDTPEGMEVRWYADSTYYTPEEYTKKQDEEVKLSEARAVTTAYEATLELLEGGI